ncbi:MAG: hypothetical protein HKO02_10760 [Hyphomonadaceae bacterium]|nr:hypothetical protein [Hyphomonadaceae bacterium]
MPAISNLNITKIALLSFCVLGLTGCGSSKPGTQNSASIDYTAKIVDGYEVPGPVKSADFLPGELLESPFHLVAAAAHNDGFANAYEIETEDYVFVVQGTELALRRILEIEATERARDISSLKTVGGTAAKKTGNLVATPYRFLKAGFNRTKKVDSAKDALLLVPSGVGEVLGKVGTGIYEMGKTGVGVAKDGVEAVADGDGDRCSVGECARDAGSTLKSGFDSLTGTKSRARRLHQELGTDPFTDNHLLQRQVARVAYSGSLTSAGFSVGLGFVGVPAFNAYASGVGYYNNAEYLAQYSDPDARREQERALLESWGADPTHIDNLYSNDAFTPTTRTRLVQSLSKVNSPEERLNILAAAVPMRSRYLVNVQLRTLRHMVELQQKGGRILTLQRAPLTIVKRTDGTEVLTIAADHLKWTPLVTDYIGQFAQLPTQGARKEVHILGAGSKLFKRKAKALDLRVVEIPSHNTPGPVPISSRPAR